MNKDIAVHNQEGTKTETITVEDSRLESAKGEQAVHETVQAYLANQRRGTASAKTRSEVRGGGEKPYRQKGTGRARAGSIRSPLWIGGGVTFGPKPRSYYKRVNKKVKRLALKRAFTERLTEGAVVALEELALQKPNTKALSRVMNSLNATRTALLVFGQADTNVKQSSRNLEHVFATEAEKVNPYWLLKHETIVFTKSGWEIFSKRLDGGSTNEGSV